MRTLLTAVLVLLLGSSAAFGAVDPVAPDWPAGEPARHAREWFAAYAAGDEAMRAFWTAHGSAAALAERPVEPRVRVAQAIHLEQGTLTPVRVSGSGADFCEVLVQSEREGAMLVRFLCEPDAPHGLVALRLQPAPDDPPLDSRPIVRGEGARSAPQPEPVGPPPTDAQLVAALSGAVDSLSGSGAFSGAVLLDRGGTPLYAKAAGEAVREPHAANTLETRFNLGSINKIFTQVAILQLVQAGKLSLDDSLAHLLPDYRVANGGHATVRMLLEHRAGVPDVFASPALARGSGRVRTQADWYAAIRDYRLDFAPGTRQRYSNGGFVLLGEIISRVSGEDYYDYVRRHVYEPAGMTRSGHFAKDELGEGFAAGYARQDAGAPNTAGLPGRGSAAGGGYSTVGDLLRFANALRAHRLLDAAHTREVTGESFSLGIAGGSPGVNALLELQGPYTLVILANIDPPAAERFVPTVGRLLRRAASASAPRP